MGGKVCFPFKKNKNSIGFFACFSLLIFITLNLLLGQLTPFQSLSFETFPICSYVHRKKNRFKSIDLILILSCMIYTNDCLITLLIEEF